MLVVGLNQTIDRTIRLPALAPGHVLRALEARVTPGGKAVNVCRAARTVVHPARLVGPFPGRLGAVARELLVAEGLDVEAVAVDGEIRGTTVVLEDGGRTTVINEPGPALDSVAWRRVVAAVERAVVGGAWMAVCGSVPPGVDPGAHAALIALAHDRGAHRSPSTSPAGGSWRRRRPAPTSSAPTSPRPRTPYASPVARPSPAARRSTSTTATEASSRAAAGRPAPRSSRSAPARPSCRPVVTAWRA